MYIADMIKKFEGILKNTVILYLIMKLIESIQSFIVINTYECRDVCNSRQ